MIFAETSLPGAFIIDIQWHEDDRGAFGRVFCTDEFRKVGIEAHVAQANISKNARRATLRGLHYQRAPHAEAKIIRVNRGRIYDVIADLRPQSPTYTRWFGVYLDGDAGQSLYVPAGLAHGFLTLDDRTEIFYLMSAPYVEEAAAGVRFDDPALGIVWPEPPQVISPRDLSFPPFSP